MRYAIILLFSLFFASPVWGFTLAHSTDDDAVAFANYWEHLASTGYWIPGQHVGNSTSTFNTAMSKMSSLNSTCSITGIGAFLFEWGASMDSSIITSLKSQWNSGSIPPVLAFHPASSQVPDYANINDLDNLVDCDRVSGPDYCDQFWDEYDDFLTAVLSFQNDGIPTIVYLLDEFSMGGAENWWRDEASSDHPAYGRLQADMIDYAVNTKGVDATIWAFCDVGKTGCTGSTCNEDPWWPYIEGNEDEFDAFLGFGCQTNNTTNDLGEMMCMQVGMGSTACSSTNWAVDGAWVLDDSNTYYVRNDDDGWVCAVYDESTDCSGSGSSNQPLTQVSSLAACKATGGTWFWDWAGGEYRIYVHCDDNGQPSANVKLRHGWLIHAVMNDINVEEGKLFGTANLDYRNEDIRNLVDYGWGPGGTFQAASLMYTWLNVSNPGTWYDIIIDSDGASTEDECKVLNDDATYSQYVLTIEEILPFVPTMSAPAQGASGILTYPTITGSTFYGPRKHTQTTYQVDAVSEDDTDCSGADFYDAECNGCDINVTTANELTTKSTWPTQLSDDSFYCARMRYAITVDSSATWGEWSVNTIDSQYDGNYFETGEGGGDPGLSGKTIGLGGSKTVTLGGAQTLELVSE